jgi:hypothetical protein
MESLTSMRTIALVTVAWLGAGVAAANVVTIGPGVGGYDNLVREAWLRGYGDPSNRENHSTRDPNAAASGVTAAYRMYALNAEASRQGGAAYLLRFDLAGAGVPQGATINSATLTLYYRNNSGVSTTGRRLAKLLPGRNWTEGASTFAGPAVSGEPTWNSRISYPVGNVNRIPWATAGGSYGDGDGAGTNPADHEAASAISFDTTGGGFLQKTFDVKTWVQAWVTTPANNAGMVAWGGTDATPGVNGFWSLVGRADSSSPSFRPSLVIDFTPGGGPTAPIIAQPPDPDSVVSGSEYVRQLTLVQGNPAPTWTLLQGPAGAVVNSSGRVSGWTPSACNAGSLFAFQVRAQNAQGSDTKSWQVSVQPAAPPSSSVVLDEPLTNSTTQGVRLGGTFQADGWRVLNNLDAIYWHISPTIVHGRYEYDIKGVNLHCVGCCYSDGGTFLLNELSHMYDYTFENADTNYIGYRNNPYKHAYKRFSYALPNTIKMLWAINGTGSEDWAGSGLSWNAATTYHIKVEWEPTPEGGSDYRAYRDTQLIHSTHLSQRYTPVGHSFRIASGGRTEEAAYIGAVYSNVKFWSLGGVQGVPPVIDAVTPDPDTAWYGSAYSKQLTLQQGSPTPDWCLIQAPPGTQLNSVTGLVSGYAPAFGHIGTQVLFQARAVNAVGTATESWQVLVKARGDLDLDRDCDQADFGRFQRCLSGDTNPHPPGCQDADLDGDGDVDPSDFTRLLNCMDGANVPIEPHCAD